MCRFFGLHAGPGRVPATFWLHRRTRQPGRAEPPESGRRGHRRFRCRTADAVVDKQPLAAWHDAEFATAAHDCAGRRSWRTFATPAPAAGPLANTHPFLQDGRLFAHNGVLAGADRAG